MTYFPLHQTTCFFIPLVAPCKPLLASNDEFFGKRNHGKSREEKERQLLDSVKKYGYW